jgi:plasmid stabilization system protein ParE
MPELKITETFVAEASQIYTDKLFNKVFQMVDTLKTMPELGSRNLPESIIKKYGSGCRKLVVSPFDIIYRYNQPQNLVEIIALVHERAAF